MGEVSDRELARSLSLAQSTVTKARVRRGIPPYSPPPPGGWTPANGAELKVYRVGAGFSFRRMAAALLRPDGSGYTHQGVAIAEKRAERPLSRTLAVALSSALRAGRLPQPKQRAGG